MKQQKGIHESYYMLLAEDKMWESRDLRFHTNSESFLDKEFQRCLSSSHYCHTVWDSNRLSIWIRLNSIGQIGISTKLYECTENIQDIFSLEPLMLKQCRTIISWSIFLKRDTLSKIQEWYQFPKISVILI